MDWSIDYLEEDNIVSMKTSGPADWDTNQQMSREALVMGRKNNANRFLVDHRKIGPGLSVLQIDNLPRMLRQMGITADDKIAIVFDPVSQTGSTFSFFKNVSFLEGLAVQIFTDTKEATAWLKTDC